MEFKNDQFEKNAARTLQTLQELKQKLNENFSTKGPEELNRAIKAVDVSPITKGIETVQVQFSALQIAGKRVIENITDAAMNAIHTVTSKLSGVFNQIKVGGANRAQNIASAKFMLEGLGIEWAEIEQDISYGVQDTAYGLDAAAKVASQLVASNIQLGDDMRMALRGISGVAAMSNSTYEEIGHIFTSIAGQGRVMGIQLTQLATRGLNVAATLATALNTTEAEIKDMVSKGQIDFMTFAKAMDDAYGEHAKEANKTFTGALSNTKAALSRLGADIQAQKFETFRVVLLEITTQLKNLKKAMKPVEESIIKMIEAVGNLVASFVKSVNISGIVDKIAPKIQKFCDLITNVASAWTDIHETERKLNSITYTNIADYYMQRANAFKDATDEVATSVDKLVTLSDKELEKYSKNAWDIWNFGKYGNGQDRIDALGADYEMTQEYVNKMIELGWDEAKMEEYLTEQKKKAEEQTKREERVSKVKKTVSSVLEILNNLKRVVSNVLGSIVNVLSAAFSGIRDAVSGKGKGFLDILVTLTGKIADFSDKIYISESRAKKISPVVKGIADILIKIAKTIVKIVKGIVDFISAASKNKIVQGIFDGIKKAIDGILTGIKNLYNKLKESGAWNGFVNILKIVFEWLGEKLITALGLIADVGSSVGDGLLSIFGKIVDKLKSFGDETERGHGWLSKIKDFFTEDIIHGSWLTKLKEVLTDIFGTGKDVFKTAFDKASDFMNGLIQGIKNIDQDDLDRIIGILTKLGVTLTTIKWMWSMVAVNKSFANMTGTLSKMFDAVGVTLKKYGKRADAQRFESFAKSVTMIVGSFVALMVAFAVLEHYGYDAERMKRITLYVVLPIMAFVGGIMVLTTWLTKANNVMQNGNKTFNILGNTRIPAFAATLFAIGYMFNSILKAVMQFYDLMSDKHFDPSKMKAITVNFLLILMGLGTFVAIAIGLSKRIAGFTGLALTLIATAILLKSLVSSFKSILKTIKGVDVNEVKLASQTVVKLITPILIFAGIMAIINKFPTSRSAGTANPFKGLMGAFIGLALLIRVGFVPLLTELAKLRRQGEAGTRAIRDFKSILKGLLIFLGVLVGVLAVLDRVVNVGGRQIGSAFVDGKLVGGVTGSGFSTSSKNTLMTGVIGIIAAIAAMFAAIAYILKNMKGIDNHAITRLKEMVTTILIIIGVLSAVAGIAGAVSGNTVTFALLGLAAVILSVAGMLLAAGYGFKAFTESLVNFVNALPSMVDKLLEFFTKVADSKDAIVQGVQDTVGVVFAGITAGVVAWAEGLAASIPTMVAALFDCMIAVLNGVADQIFLKGDKVIDAADYMSSAIVYFLLLVRDKVLDKAKGLFENTVGKALVSGIEALFPGLDIDNSELGLDYTGPDPDKLRREYEQRKKALEQSKTSYDEMEARMKKASDERVKAANKIDGGNLLSINDDTIDNFVDGLFTSVTSKVGASNLTDLKKVFGDKLSSTFSTSELTNLISQGSFGDINSLMGNGFDVENMSNLWGDLDLTTESGLNQLTTRLDTFMHSSDTQWETYADNYEGYGEESMDNLAKGIDERMQFVTEITQDAGQKAVDEIEKFESDFYRAGKFCAQGFADGIQDYDSNQRLYHNVADMVTQARKKLEKKAEISSPSKVFKRLGAYITLGFAEGIKNSVSAATGAALDVGEVTILSMRDTIKRISMEAVDGLDAPRIRPVLDLSDVSNGLDTMNGMFDNTRSVRLGALTSAEAQAATSRRVNAFYQNGSSYDDTNALGALNSLSAEVATLKDSIEGMQVVIDGRALVGQIATPMDKALGKRSISERRGV